MSKHHGQTLEKVIRKGSYSITEIARMANVDRRSVYNWFNFPVLRAEIIYKIGHKMMHDFSAEFPELFNSSDFAFKNNPSLSSEECRTQDPFLHSMDEDSHWKEKYLNLYPKYEKLLQSVYQNENA
jgi:hypothetical protein